MIFGKILCPKMLLDIGSIISNKKDCLNMCDHPKTIKVSGRRMFWCPRALQMLMTLVWMALQALEATQNNMVVRNPGLMADIIVWKDIC